MKTKRLVADVGGTNTRLALFDESDGEFSALATFSNREFDSLEAVLDQWLASLDEPSPERGCIAVAAPPSGDQVSMINIGWAFSCNTLARRFGLRQFTCLNDFEANAHALPYLQGDDLEEIYAGREGGHTTLATVGPGTGLGGSTLQWVNGVAVARASEPGHASLAPVTDLEFEIFRALLPTYGDIYVELLVSGAGLARLYEVISQVQGRTPEALTPAQVSQRAAAGEDATCEQALHTFCDLLGSTCGDFVLSNGAYGGLFIAGGIVPRVVPFLRQSDFLQRFRAKGAMRKHLEIVPVHVITTDHPGLIGAAHAPLQER